VEIQRGDPQCRWRVRLERFAKIDIDFDTGIFRSKQWGCLLYCAGDSTADDRMPGAIVCDGQPSACAGSHVPGFAPIEGRANVFGRGDRARVGRKGCSRYLVVDAVVIDLA